MNTDLTAVPTNADIVGIWMVLGVKGTFNLVAWHVPGRGHINLQGNVASDGETMARLRKHLTNSGAFKGSIPLRDKWTFLSETDNMAHGLRREFQAGNVLRFLGGALPDAQRWLVDVFAAELRVMFRPQHKH